MKMNDISSGYFNNIVPLDIIGLQKEKERNLKKEINYGNIEDNDFKSHIDNIS